MERKKRSKGRGWESCYVKKIYGTFGVEMRAYGQKLVKFCTHTHTRLSYSSIDKKIIVYNNSQLMKKNLAVLINDLKETNWNTVIHSENVNFMYDTFSEKLANSYKKLSDC